MKLAKLISFLIFFKAIFAFGQLVEIPEVFEPGTPPGLSLVKVAVLQWAPPVAPIGITAEQAEAFKATNRETLASYMTEASAHGAKLVVSSEMGVVGYPDIPDVPSEEDNFMTRAQIEPYLETVPGPSTEYFGALAKKLGVYLQFALAEKDAKTNLIYNAAVAVGPDGQVVGKHRKHNLFHIETNYFTPGTEFGTYQTPFGLFGMIICSDVYDSQLLGEYKRLKVNNLALSTSWAQFNTGMNYFQNAAKTVGAYLLAANQPYFPDSGVINPDGSLQSHIRQTNGLAYGYLPLVTATKVKKTKPSNPTGGAKFQNTQSHLEKIARGVSKLFDFSSSKPK